MRDDRGLRCRSKLHLSPLRGWQPGPFARPPPPGRRAAHPRDVHASRMLTHGPEKRGGGRGRAGLPCPVLGKACEHEHEPPGSPPIGRHHTGWAVVLPLEPSACVPEPVRDWVPSGMLSETHHHPTTRDTPRALLRPPTRRHRQCPPACRHDENQVCLQSDGAKSAMHACCGRPSLLVVNCPPSFGGPAITALPGFRHGL